MEDATTDIDSLDKDLRDVLNKGVFDSDDSKFWIINRNKDSGDITLVF